MNDTAIWTAVIGGFGALSSAIGYQYRTTMAHMDRVQKKLDECEDDRKTLHKEQRELWMVVAKQCGKQIEELKGDKE